MNSLGKVAFEVFHKFVSKKTKTNWGGMKKENYQPWLLALEENVVAYKQELFMLFKSKKKLTMLVTISGERQRIDPLDAHDALAQIADEITDVLFPRPEHSPKPQTEDSAFWQEEVRKLVGDTKVRIEIGEFAPDSVSS